MLINLVNNSFLSCTLQPQLGLNRLLFLGCLFTAVIATTTHTTVVTTTPQQYPQQPIVSPGQSYQGAQYPPYQPVPVQPGYGSQPMPQGYGAQPMPTMPYHGQPFTPGPPPTYHEAGECRFPDDLNKELHI